jgi:hypothetical protein
MNGPRVLDKRLWDFIVSENSFLCGIYENLGAFSSCSFRGCGGHFSFGVAMPKFRE